MNPRTIQTGSLAAGLVLSALLMVFLGSCVLADPFQSGSSRLSLNVGTQPRGFTMPVLQAGDVSTYSLHITNSTGYDDTLLRTNADIQAVIELTPGTWDLLVLALNGSGVEIGRNSLELILGAGDVTVDVPIYPTLVRSGTGTGKAELVFAFAAPQAVVSAGITLASFNAGVLGAPSALADPEAVFDPVGQTLTVTLDNLASGDYLLELESSSALGAYNKISHQIKVYDNLTSRGTINVDAALLTAVPPDPLEVLIDSVTTAPDNLSIAWNWDASTGFKPLGYRIFIDGALTETMTEVNSYNVFTHTGGGAVAASYRVVAYNAAGEAAGATLDYVPLVSVAFDQSSFTLAANTQASLGITWIPANANPKEIYWESTNSSIAFMGAGNTIQASSTAGTVTLTSRTMAGIELGTVTVTVLPDLVGYWDFETGDGTNGGSASELTLDFAGPADSSDARASYYSLNLAGNGYQISDSTAGQIYQNWTGPWTVMFWMQADSTHAVSDPLQALVTEPSDPSDGLWLQRNGSSSELVLVWNSGYYSFNAPITFDEWTHVALMHTGTSLRLYVDGVLQATEITDPAVLAGLSIPLGRIGENNNGSSGFFWGRMDDVEYLIREEYPAQLAWRVSQGMVIGKGTELTPYAVASEADFLSMPNKQRLFFRQIADLALSTNFYNRFNGSDGNAFFRGTYDGNGFSITGLDLQEAWYDAGLFGSTENATLRNVNLTGSITRTGNVSSGNTGLLVGKAIHTRVENTKVTGTLTNDGAALGTVYLGGMVGRLDGGAILDSVARVDVSGGYVAGGLVGYVYTNTQTYEAAGGAVISNSASVGTVSSTEALNVAGGLIGRVYNGTTNALADKAVIKSSFHQGNVTADYIVGGLIGLVYNNVVSGTDGISIIDSYARTPTLTTFKTGSPVYQGGLVGYIINNGADGGTIQNSWAVASLVHTATGYANAFIGLVAGTAVNLSGNFFDSDVSPTDPLVTGVNTAAMMSLAGFTAAGWSIGTGGAETWRIAAGTSYPWLSWQVLDFPLAP